MPRGGSRKGEHRGNAKARPTHSHETPNDVMREAAQKARRRHRKGAEAAKPPARVEERISIARLVHGPVDDIRDMTPKEVLLDNMHYAMQAAYDWQIAQVDASERLKADPNDEDAAGMLKRAEAEIEKFRRTASDDAYRVAPFIHPRLAAMSMTTDPRGPIDIINELLNDIDTRQRMTLPTVQRVTESPAEEAAGD